MKKKFKFCRDRIDFAGLKITLYGVSPSDNILPAITGFQTPTNITGAWSWFGLVNQVVWTYAISPIMQPFPELVKYNFTFTWIDWHTWSIVQKCERYSNQQSQGGNTFIWNQSQNNFTNWFELRGHRVSPFPKNIVNVILQRPLHVVLNNRDRNSCQTSHIVWKKTLYVCQSCIKAGHSVLHSTIERHMWKILYVKKLI